MRLNRIKKRRQGQAKKKVVPKEFDGDSNSKNIKSISILLKEDSVDWISVQYRGNQVETRSAKNTLLKIILRNPPLDVMKWALQRYPSQINQPSGWHLQEYPRMPLLIPLEILICCPSQKGDKLSEVNFQLLCQESRLRYHIIPRCAWWGLTSSKIVSVLEAATAYSKANNDTVRCQEWILYHFAGAHIINERNSASCDFSIFRTMLEACATFGGYPSDYGLPHKLLRLMQESYSRRHPSKFKSTRLSRCSSRIHLRQDDDDDFRPILIDIEGLRSAFLTILHHLGPAEFQKTNRQGQTLLHMLLQIANQHIFDESPAILRKEDEAEAWDQLLEICIDHGPDQITIQQDQMAPLHFAAHHKLPSLSVVLDAMPDALTLRCGQTSLFPFQLAAAKVSTNGDESELASSIYQIEELVPASEIFDHIDDSLEELRQIARCCVDKDNHCHYDWYSETSIDSDSVTRTKTSDETDHRDFLVNLTYELLRQAPHVASFELTDSQEDLLDDPSYKELCCMKMGIARTERQLAQQRNKMQELEESLGLRPQVAVQQRKRKTP